MLSYGVFAVLFLALSKSFRVRSTLKTDRNIYGSNVVTDKKKIKSKSGR